MTMDKVFISFLLTLLVIPEAIVAENKPNVTFSIEEEKPNNTHIGSLIKELDLQNKYSPEEFNDLFFKYLSQQANLESLFHIDSKTSEIFTARVINRESDGVCKLKSSCVFDFDVMVTGETSSIFEIILVRIIIIDINDETPTFSPSYKELNISEMVAKSSSYLIENAQDLDRGAHNSIQTYELVSLQPQNEFVLQEEKSSIDGSTILKLVVDKELNYETKNSYNLQLLAKDGGSPQRTGTLTIRINVIDENDNIPVFKDSFVNVTVTENLKPDSLIFTFSAEDKDSGKNGEVFYRLKSFQAQEIYDLFSVGEVTGQLKTRAELNFIKGKIYTIIVEAVDRGVNPQLSSAIVHLTVEDTGNNPPKISITFQEGGSSSRVKLCECASLEKFVAHIQVEDTDTGVNGDVTCSMRSTYFGLASLGDRGYRVIVQANLDRETIPVHELTVKCKDNGNPPLEATANFTVELNDANDNAPKFSEHYYTVSIPENSSPGTPVVQIIANDIDIGPNGQITYSIVSPMDQYFIINSTTGLVKTKKVFDRESEVTVRFDVIAADKGTPESKNSSTAVIVNIQDVNDNAPSFKSAIFLHKVMENVQIGTSVGTLTAIDDDLGENGLIIYSLHPDENPEKVPFMVNKSGVIVTNGDLDREKTSQYDFKVQAVDSGLPEALTGTAQVTVMIKDDNDNIPQFIFPSEENFTISIPHNTPVDSIIASIQAYDLDENENGKVIYSIATGNDANIFYLNPQTGGLYIRDQLIITKDTEYNLNLNIKDRGDPFQQNFRELHVLVKYVNTTTKAITHGESERDKFVLIVVSVVCVTVVLSVGLLAVICVLRRREKDKNNNADLEFPAGRNSVPNMYENVPPNSEPKSYPSPQKSSSKPFTLQKNSAFTKTQLLEKLTGSPTGNYQDVSPDKEHLVVQIPTMKPPPAYSQKRQNPDHKKQEESSSETSGETIPSDSGHGGSEEDFTHSPENGTTFALNPVIRQGKDTPDIFVIRQHGREKDVPITKSSAAFSKNTPPPAYNHLKLHNNQHQNIYLDDSLLTTSMNSMWSDPSQKSQLPPHNSHLLPTIPQYSNLKKSPNIDFNGIFYNSGTLGSHSAHSRDDDDCTTTSGSYTINDEQDFDDEFKTMHSKDLYV